MRLMLLGASNAQMNTIRKAKALGIEVVAADYYLDSPGKAIADYRWLGSTFDVSAILKGAITHKIDGIMTMGTDQPVLTCAVVAQKLGLPSFIDMETALWVTNKKWMKKRFLEKGLPTVNYSLFQPGESGDDALSKLTYPVVVKPLDSQGQRGIFYINSKEEAALSYDKVIIHSREKEILIEEYYENDEITVSGWVNEGILTILTITDRVCFTTKAQLGICLSHEFPSKHMDRYDEIKALSENILQAFHIYNGPIYFQFLIGKEGIKINEIACRIGGAYEDEFIPLLSGVDIGLLHIQGALGLPMALEPLKAYEVQKTQKFLSVQLFFLKEGRIKALTPIHEVLDLEGVVNMGYNVEVSDRVDVIENGAQRGGYVIVTAASKNELEHRLKGVYDKLIILDENDQNMVVHRQLEV